MIVYRFCQRNHLKIVCLLALLSVLAYSLSKDQLLNNNSSVSDVYCRKWLCVNSDTAICSPSADGIVMNLNASPHRWTLFDSESTDVTDRRIFFHITSDDSELNLKQCCVVESAARHNADRSVFLFLRPPSQCSSAAASSAPRFVPPPAWFKVLASYANVKVVLINEEHYFNGSPLQEWYTKGEWRQSRFKNAHLADYYRVLSLHKNGGLFLDASTLILKQLKGDTFTNFFSYIDDRKVDIGSAAIHLERGHWLPNEIMKLITEDYDPDSYVYNGPEAYRAALVMAANKCDGKINKSKLHYSKNQCVGNVKVLASHYFYPVTVIVADIPFVDGNQTDVHFLESIKKSHGIHLWNSLSSGLRLPINMKSEHQIFSILAREHCPITVANWAGLIKRQ